MSRSARIALLLLAIAAPADARAFCGCMVSSQPGQALVSEASMVVLAREGDRTVLTMRNDYRGPPEDFALVVPIPSSVRQGDVRTLDDGLFEQLDRLTAPRLYDYYERDPCWDPNFPTPSVQHRGMGWVGPMWLPRGLGGRGAPDVEVESHFAVDEYDVVVLGASESATLDGWLRRHGYHVPDGFEAAVRPYVERGDRFFVARVNAEELELEDGYAVLSPLRVSYQSERFELPIRLGLLNCDSEQDLIVHVLAPDTRYVVSSYPRATIPTHYRVDEAVRGRFEELYEALFTETLERHPGAVVTEWAYEVGGEGSWDTALPHELLRAFAEPLMAPPEVQLRSTRHVHLGPDAVRVRGSLSADAVAGVLREHLDELRYCYEVAESNGEQVEMTFVVSPNGAAQSAFAEGETLALSSCMSQAVRRLTFPEPRGGGVAGVTVTIPAMRRTGAVPAPPAGRYWTSETPLVLTRLHMRYDEHIRDDLVFARADPITGGTYGWAQRERGPFIVRAARRHERNAFEARYFIGHDWEGPVSCGDNAIRGAWIPGWRDGEEVVHPYAGIGEDGEPLEREPSEPPLVLEDAIREAVPELELEPRVPAEPPEPPTPAPPPAAPPTEDSGCGCRAAGGEGAPIAALLLLGLLLSARWARGRSARR